MENVSQELIGKVASWKEIGRPLAVNVVGKERTEPAEVFIRDWSPRQRRLRALKSLAVWWGIGLLTVFIPLLHLFLVPACFIVGLIVWSSVRKMERTILGGVGICPYCAKSFEISGHRDRWPMEDICDLCHRHVQLHQNNGPSSQLDIHS